MSAKLERTTTSSELDSGQTPEQADAPAASAAGEENPEAVEDDDAADKTSEQAAAAADAAAGANHEKEAATTATNEDPSNKETEVWEPPVCLDRDLEHNCVQCADSGHFKKKQKCHGKKCSGDCRHSKVVLTPRIVDKCTVNGLSGNFWCCTHCGDVCCTHCHVKFGSKEKIQAV